MNSTVDLVDKVRHAVAESEFLAAIASAREAGGILPAHGRCDLRTLSAEEIADLERQGNSSTDWSRVHVARSFDSRTVRASQFQGDIVLGHFEKSALIRAGIQVPSGIYGSTLIDCVVGDNALVKDVRLLARYVVGEAAIVFDCGCISCEGPTAFGNGFSLSFGAETGGRDIRVHAEIDLEAASAVAHSRVSQDAMEAYSREVAEYTMRATSDRGVIGRDAVVRNSTEIRNTYVGPHAQVAGAVLVDECTLLSSEDEPVSIRSGGCVRNSVLQWGSSVDTLAVVENSVLLEQSHVERHAKVLSSIVGPNTIVAEGEVNSSLLGPFVGFHHQALLIAALWPEGKGNVAAGANVGSNHTTRLPDQEFRQGEGLFIGLGVNVKYPSDFTRAPYSVLAAGVVTLPQKLAFPFSLVSRPWSAIPNVSPELNELIPAWVLTDDLYMLKRNEEKYRQRNKARRTAFDHRIFRPDIVDLMRDACRRLSAVPHVADVYSEDQIAGLGKNFLRETNRLKAIEAYRFFIHHYALQGLADRVLQLVRAGQGSRVGDLLELPSREQPWEYQRRILTDDMSLCDVVAALRQWTAGLRRIAQGVEASKARDDVRGRRILDDYSEVHVEASRDALVQQTWAETRDRIAEMERSIAFHFGAIQVTA